MKWMIATPDGAAVWNGAELHYIDAPDRSTLPRGDAHEALWKTYYRNICNVARINTSAMQREMPQRYWRHLPEASEIPGLLHEGTARLDKEPCSAEQTSMPRAVADALARIAVPTDTPMTCRRCDLWKNATQAVVGEGSERASLMLVGEQPGDEEDIRGRPFVGPAGRLLDQALQAAGVEREEIFITNAVKHFKWEPRGKRRLHKRPDLQEISACHVWLDQEIARVSPRVIVALGATALRALAGHAQSIESARRAMFRHTSGATLLVTYHPSAILRAEGERADQLKAALVEDLQRAASLGHSASQGSPGLDLNTGLNA
jgi:DNA polymerase